VHAGAGVLYQFIHPHVEQGCSYHFLPSETLREILITDDWKTLKIVNLDLFII